MKIKLQQEWMGNQPDSIICVQDHYAKVLIDRKTAIEVKEEVKEHKGFKKPEINKMVGGPEINK